MDYNQYLSKVPQGHKFLRFAELPKEIVAEFFLKSLPFFLEKDTVWKIKGKPTYKFAVGKQGEFDYLKRLLEQNGWERSARLPCYF